MKRISYLFSLLFLMTFVAFTSCKTEEDPDPIDPVEERLALIDGTHTVTSVSAQPGGPVDLDGQVVTLTFTETGVYTGTNTDVLPGDFPASGTLTIPNASNLNAARIGTLNINITSVTANGMTFTYQATDPKINGGAPFTVTVVTTK